MYTNQVSETERARIMARVDAMHAREGITGQEAREARERALDSRVTGVFDTLRDSEGAMFDVVDTGGRCMAYVATLADGSLFVANGDADPDTLATAEWWRVADAAGWHDGEDVTHEPMTLADAIVRAAGL